MTVQDNSVQSINAVLIALQKEIEQLRKQVKTLEGKINETN